MAVDVHAIAASRLGASGQRYTPSRRAVVEALQRAGRPLTIPEILEGDRALPQSSAYRTIAVLTQVGVVRRVVAVDEFTRFELAEDLSSHHHHLLCTSCGLVADFELPPALERELEAAFEAAATEQRFESIHHRVDLVGRCTNCST
ncbi:MAG TPA: transcriptional repressor [Acidimicrobiales bacterium]|nr:transcriptional repressor [Acidimicrobiales bacterium]